mgnify:CR=1 FL=1
MDEKTKENPLATMPIGKLLLRYGMPAVLSSLVNSVYNLADQIFIGQSLGAAGDAATIIVFPLVMLSAALTLLIGVGGPTS